MVDEADVTLMVELEEKITQRIRKELFVSVANFPPLNPDNIKASEVNNALLMLIRGAVINDQWTVTELTKKIGAKMSNVNY